MRRLDAVVTGVAALAVAVPVFVVTHPPVIPVRRGIALPQRHIMPKAQVPVVEPMRLVDLSPDEARQVNAAIPFSTDANPAARPFRYGGDADNRARAIDCMAAGTLYEAGDDAEGERAVAQVILNRLHHPAFPKTICGVVFEGQERSTGCQFSFSCDGAVDRWHPSAVAWRRARDIATAAVSGAVYRPVGYATHYHTDWVVPYWQASLDKIAAVHTHLFFRWSGWWGTPPAFQRHPEAVEPVITQLAPLSDAHRNALASADAVAPATAGLSLDARGLAPLPSDPNSFLTLINPRAPADSYRALALKACGERPKCRVMGWIDAGAMGFALPLTDEQVAFLSFSYLRDRPGGYEKALWDCTQFPRARPGECMKRRMPAANPPIATAPGPTPPIGGLSGVHRTSAGEAVSNTTLPSGG